MMTANTELGEKRKQMFAPLEPDLEKMHPKEDDSLFYYHPSEDRIVLSHALFLTMTMPRFLRKMLEEAL